MARNKRAELKRHCEYAIKDIDRALHHFGCLMEVYYPDYPDYYMYVQTWIDALNAVKESLANFREMI